MCYFFFLISYLPTFLMSIPHNKLPCSLAETSGISSQNSTEAEEETNQELSSQRCGLTKFWLVTIYWLSTHIFCKKAKVNTGFKLHVVLFFWCLPLYQVLSLFWSTLDAKRLEQKKYHNATHALWISGVKRPRIFTACR